MHFGVRMIPILMASAVLAGCQGSIDSLLPKEKTPVPAYLVKKMKTKGMALDAPIMLRIFKKDSELEVWKKTHTGRYALLETYEICKWSGKLGPKFKEGDRQAPEGFYTVNKYQMNPNSQYHLSFNMGFPNRYDRSHGRTGSHLMIHGACSSAGCYSMTDEKVEEIYAMARDSLAGGQERFQIQAYPFRMTTKNMVEHRDNPYFDFWKMLKRGHDQFEITRVPPKVDVCEKRYVFNTTSKGQYSAGRACPALEMPATLANAYVKQQNTYATEFEKLLAKAERRKPGEIDPVTVGSVLPGIVVPAPKPAVPAQPAISSDADKPTGDDVADTKKADDAQKAASDEAKPPLEATLTPAG